MPQKTFFTSLASGKQSARKYKYCSPGVKPLDCLLGIAESPPPTPPQDKIVSVKILELNDTYQSNYFGMWGQKALEIINSNTTPDTTFVKILAGDYLFTSKFSSIMYGHEMLLASNACKFDVGSLGNHEFDYGTKTLSELALMSSFPLVCSNMSSQQASDLNLVNTYSFVKNGIKFGVIGYLSQTSPLLSEGAKNITFYDIDYMFTKYKAFLQEHEVRILLFHENISMIVDYLNSNPTKKLLVDAIGCGHEHIIYKNYVSRGLYNIPIVEMGSDAAGLGYIDLSFNTVTRKCVSSDVQVITIDPTIKNLPQIDGLNTWVNSICNPVFQETIGTVKNFDLNGLRTQVRNFESNLGNLMADAYLYTGTVTTPLNALQGNVFSFLNGGGIRNNSILSIGTVFNTGTIYSVTPFNNLLVAIELTGRTSVNNFLKYIAGVSLSKRNAGGWAQISSNLIFNYITNSYSLQSGTMSETDKFYCITYDFLANGNDGYSDLVKYTNLNMGYPIQTSAITYIKTLGGNISISNDYKRIII